MSFNLSFPVNRCSESYDVICTIVQVESTKLFNDFINNFSASFRLLKTTYHKKHGADRICFTHHPSSVICSSRYDLDSTGGKHLTVRFLL